MKRYIERSIRKINDHHIIKIALVLVVIIIAVVLSLSFEFSQARAFIRQHPRQTAIISIGIYFLLGFTFIPASPLTVFIALLMSPIEAIIIASVGNTLAAILEYHIGKAVGDVFDFEEKKSKLPFGLSKLPVNSPYFLLIGRSLPIGKRGLSIVSGAYQVPFGLYLWTTVVMYIFNATVVAYGLVKLIKAFFNTISIFP